MLLNGFELKVTFLWRRYYLIGSVFGQWENVTAVTVPKSKKNTKKQERIAGIRPCHDRAITVALKNRENENPERCGNETQKTHHKTWHLAVTLKKGLHFFYIGGKHNHAA